MMMSRLGPRRRASVVTLGGHFAAWEQPELFSAEIRAAFKSLRPVEKEAAR
jgi:pimeloyl-ACP methyl ester carboxylesterase